MQMKRKRSIGPVSHFTKVPGLRPMPTAERLAKKYGISKKELMGIEVAVAIYFLLLELKSKYNISTKYFYEIVRHAISD